MENKITIDQKMSNTGTIHDIASEHYDIEINMGKSFKYVVILPSFYNAGYTRHKTAGRAIEKYNEMSRAGYDPTILNRDGKRIDVKHGFYGLELDE